MVLNQSKIPWMRDDRVINTLAIGAHRSDNVIEAYTHKTWSQKHTKKVRIELRQPDKFSQDKFEQFMGFENTYNVKVRPHTSYTATEEDRMNLAILPNLDLDALLHDKFTEGSIPDSLQTIHKTDVFNIQRSKNLIRQYLDFCGFSCFRYRYNYFSNAIAESMELAQYVDADLPDVRSNHRFIVIDAVTKTTKADELRSRVAGKALVTALMKYMAGISGTSEIEVYCVVGQNTTINLFRIVFEPSFLGDISRGLVPDRPAYASEDFSHVGGYQLLRLEERRMLVQRLQSIRLSMHVRI